jgi:hypothetical protein
MNSTASIEAPTRLRVRGRVLAASAALLAIAGVTAYVIAEDDAPTRPEPRPAVVADATVDVRADPLVTRFGRPAPDLADDPLMVRFGQP